MNNFATDHLVPLSWVWVPLKNVQKACHFVSSYIVNINTGQKVRGDPIQVYFPVLFKGTINKTLLNQKLGLFYRLSQKPYYYFFYWILTKASVLETGQIYKVAIFSCIKQGWVPTEFRRIEDVSKIYMLRKRGDQPAKRQKELTQLKLWSECVQTEERI